jgi:hypothetical protein
MKITQIAGFRLLDPAQQRNVESLSFTNAEVARMALQKRLPDHVVEPSRAALRVTTRDGLFTVARFSLE